jgi:hypothetical protein
MQGGWKSVARYLFPYHEEVVTDINLYIPVFRKYFFLKYGAFLNSHALSEE